MQYSVTVHLHTLSNCSYYEGGLMLKFEDKLRVGEYISVPGTGKNKVTPFAVSW